MKKNYLLTILFIVLTFCICQAQGTIVVEGKTYQVDTTAMMKVGPGTKYLQLQLKADSYPQIVNFLEVDNQNQYISYSAVTSGDTIKGNERITAMAARKSKAGQTYFAGTNADFYDTSNGIPISGFMSSGQVGKRPHSSRPVIGIDGFNTPFIDIINMQASILFNGENCDITQINEARGENQLILYNQIWGKYTRSNPYGTEILIQVENDKWLTNGVMEATVVDKYVSKGNALILPRQAVLSGHGTSAAFLQKMNIGDKFSLSVNMLLSESSVHPNLNEMVGGDRIILQQGEILNNDWTERHPRTAMGYSADKGKTFFCVVDGRSAASAGVTTRQLASLMQLAGASTAFNLDGGGSSGMYVKGYGQINNPSDGVERAVSNGIFAVSSAPDDSKITSLEFKDYKIEVPIYSVSKPIVVAYNQYDALLNTNQAVTFTCSADLGRIDENGQFVASSTATKGMLTAHWGEVSVSKEIYVTDQINISLLADSILLDKKRKYKIDVIGTLDGKTFPVDSKSIVWSVEDPNVCRVVEGVVEGLNNGTTNVVGTQGNQEIRLKVNVEIPEDKMIIQEDFIDLSSFTLTASSSLKQVALSADDLPIGWNNGAKVSYVYGSGILSSIQINKRFNLYSIPDSLHLVIHTGNMPMSKLSVMMKGCDETKFKTISVSNLPEASEYTMRIKTSEILTNANNILSYPIMMSSITAYLKDGNHKVGESYHFYLKDIKLFYGDQTVGIIPIAGNLSKFMIQPNPIREGEARIILKDNYSGKKINLQIFSLTGQLLDQVEYDNLSSGELLIPVRHLQKGTYIVRLTGDGFSESTKMIIQ